MLCMTDCYLRLIRFVLCSFINKDLQAEWRVSLILDHSQVFILNIVDCSDLISCNIE